MDQSKQQQTPAQQSGQMPQMTQEEQMNAAMKAAGMDSKSMRNTMIKTAAAGIAVGTAQSLIRKLISKIFKV